MAVYTNVSFAEAAALLHTLGLGDLTDLQGIQGGIENTNYFVTSERDGATLQHVLQAGSEIPRPLVHLLDPEARELRRSGLRGGQGQR